MSVAGADLDLDDHECGDLDDHECGDLDDHECGDLDDHENITFRYKSRISDPKSAL